MSTISEASFGNKFAKGQQILDFIKTLSNYNPPNPAFGQESLSTLLQQIDEANKKVASAAGLLAQARAVRTDSYHGKEGIKKRCAMIRDFVGVLPAGKVSSAYLNIQKETQKMINYKKPSKKEESAGDGEASIKRTVSTAETGFGSLLQGAKNILEIIKNLPEYAPVNPLISIEGISQFINNLETANQSVNSLLFAYSNAVAKRQELYEGEQGLRVCFQGIKSFIAANYGKSGAEFKEVSKLKY
ncbi:MAG: hypothetical protein NW226_13015 [Microscillaceae bacterium]|nr:hypothetical protein [Microscillaceae bacterium]